MASSVPFRFKAGEAAAAHHHRSTTKSSQKPFKSRHATKGAIKDTLKGKIPSLARRPNTPHQVVINKIARRNQARQARIHAAAARREERSVFAPLGAGVAPAPRVVAVVPLGARADPRWAAARLLRAAGGGAADADAVEAQTESGGDADRVTYVERWRQSVAWVPVRAGSLCEALDACRVADFVVFVLDARDEEVDPAAIELLRAVEGQGISNVLACAVNVGEIQNPKKVVWRIASLEAFMKHFFPTIEKVNSLDSEQQCVNVLRVLCTTTPKGIHWREDRSWMKIERIDWPSPGDGDQDVVVTGVVRGKPLQSDRLVCIGDWGDFQIRKITDAPRARPGKTPSDGKRIDLHGDGFTLEEPTADQDDLLELAPEEIVMDDADSDLFASNWTKKGVLIDDTHYYPHDTDVEEVQKPKKLPRGTSSYQAAWYLGDYSDSGSDLEDVEEDDESMGVNDDAQGHSEGYADAEMRDPTEAGPSEYPQSEAFLDPSPEDEEDDIEAYRQQRQKAAAEDLEFPDEIELNPKVLARERLARYRGLKDFRTSVWDTSEDRFHEPAEWKRLLEIAHYKAARNRILKESTTKGIPAGTRVHVHLKDVPETLREASPSRPPCSMFSLLRHEHKRTAANFSISLSSEHPAPIKSKEELVMQCGPRRFVINPLFSDAGSTPNDVHRFRRYLHPGQTAVASVIAPLSWGSVPALFFVRESSAPARDAMDTADGPSHRLRLVGTGTSLPPSQARVVAKRAVLTGHPFKIHKRLVTVRYMFFNSEDVAWFRAMRLWTRRGRTGFIKESLGTHGYFKATFDGSINPLDAIAISLYKRVWPRQARPWRGDAELTSGS